MPHGDHFSDFHAGGELEEFTQRQGGLGEGTLTLPGYRSSGGHLADAGKGYRLEETIGCEGGMDGSPGLLEEDHELVDSTRG